MRRTSLILDLVIVITLLFGVFGVGGIASAQNQFTDLKALKTEVKGHPKLQSLLDQLASAHEKGVASSFAQQHSLELEAENIRVVIEAEPETESEVISKAKSLGASVEMTYENMVQAIVPIGQLKALANVRDVKLVRLPFQAVPMVIGEGVSLINTAAWHSAGFTGAGQKVGIIDLGFSGYSSLLGTELPPSVTTWWAPSIGGPGTEIHGTACAEIIYDIAPNAQFYLANFDTDVEWGNAISWLISQGVNVISCSIGFANTGPGNGSGLICNTVTTARSAGILWSQSAGNQAQRHWSGTFRSTDGDSVHDFNLSPFDETNAIYAQAGSRISVFLKWDDPWGTSGNDYDLYLLDASLNIVAWSEFEQNGNDYPTEGIVYATPLTGLYHIVINRYSATRNVFFHLVTFYQDLQYQVASGSLLEPADSPNAMTVGAVPWNNPNSLEPFSSQGPTTDNRVKPDLVAPDGVSTVTYGTTSFYGTSAAAPHGAGAALLVKDYFASYTPAQIQSYLETNAVPLGAAGKDNLYGSGRLYLSAPAPPSAPTLNAPASGSTVPSLTPRLEWNASTGATSYGVQVSTSSSFSTLLVDERGITDLFYDVQPGTLQWNTTYYWRVNAANSFGSTSSWSSSRYFKTAVGPPPEAPSDLIATPISSSRIDLTWQDNSNDETGFKIERRTVSGSYSQIATVGAGVTSYSNTGLSASTTYYYRVRAYSAAGDSGYSNEASATTLPPPPPAPTLKSPVSGATVPSLTPRLEWNASTGATSYRVQISTSSSFSTLLVDESSITDLFYDVQPGILQWNTTYYWRVNAANSFGSTSSWSSSRYFKTAIGPPPEPPSDLIATPTSSSRIDLTWQDNSSDETGFKIERRTASGSYSQIATVGAGVTTYSSTGLSANTTYYYRVRAYKATLNSAYCEEASATTLPPPPPAPTLKSPASGSTAPNLTPRLEWNSSSGAVSYGLQVSTSSGFTNLLVNEAGITYLFYDIPEGIIKWNTTYYWRVNAVNSYNSTSRWSSYRYFKTPLGPPPQPPSHLIATAISSSRIDLAWQDNSDDETGFKIERRTASGSYYQIATVGAGVTSYSNTGLSASTTYYYRVRAYKATLNSAYCEEASATTLPPPPPTPTLKSPAFGSTVSTLTPRLEWNPSSGAVSYGLQISTSSTFTTLLINESGITDLFYDVPAGVLQWNRTYYWRVNAVNSYNSTSRWSSYRYFRTAAGS